VKVILRVPMLLYIVTKKIHFHRVAEPVIMLLSPDCNRNLQEDSYIQVSSIAKGNADHRDDELINNGSKYIDGIVHETPNTAENCIGSVTSDTYDI
jgi:hypothetical protein